METLDRSRLEQALHGSIFAGRLHHFTSIDSTNTRAIADAHAGADAGAVYLADRQTAGRGRGGHQWHSANVEGLYLSVLMRPVLAAHAALLLSLATGLAVQSAIRTCTGLAVDLRWPNDIVTADGARKLGGILIESASDASGALRFAVVGIGLNLNQRHFPADLHSVASSLLLETGAEVVREDLLPPLLHALASEFARVEAEPAGDLLSRFAAASTWVNGRQVSVAEQGGYTGLTEGLDPAGLLQVRTPSGDLRIVRHGGVRQA